MTLLDSPCAASSAIWRSRRVSSGALRPTSAGLRTRPQSPRNELAIALEDCDRPRRPLA